MASHLESVPAIRSAADAQFLLCTAGQFPPEFLRGATVLLASYDLEPTPAAAPAHDAATA